MSGCLWTIALNGILGWASYRAARDGLRQPGGLPRILAAVVLGWVWATLGMEVLGAFGLLARVPLLAWSAAGLGLTIGLRRHTLPAGGVFERTSWDPECVVIVGLTLWAAALLGSQSLLYPVKVVSDGPIYHLYFAARWWKAGRIFMIAAPFGESAATYFPAVGDLWFTWLMTGWGGERLAKVGQAPFWLVSSLASYALARRLGAGRPAALLATVWFATCTPLVLFAFEPNVDMIFVAGYLLAAYFLARDALEDDRWESLVLGALAAGVSLGSKAVAIVFVPVLLALAALGVLVRRLGVRRTWRRLVALGLLPLAASGYWFGRNLALTGNPLYPLRVAPGGHVWLVGWYGPAAMKRSIYFLPMGDWRACVDHLLFAADPRLVPLWAVSLAGAWPWGRAEHQAARRVAWVCAVLAIVNVGLFWFLIPYRSQQRFLFPALGLSVVPLALALDRGRLLRLLAAALLVLHLLTPQGWPIADEYASPPWDLSPTVPNAVAAVLPLPHNLEKLQSVWADTMARGTLGRTMLVGLGAIGVAWAWARATVPHNMPRRPVWAGLATAGWVTAVLALNAPPSSDPRQTFFPLFPEYYRGWLELDSRSGPFGARVAYAGTDLPYYLLGAGLRNNVRYINVDAHRNWLMHDYHRASGYATWPDSRPGWDRLHPDYDAWLANLRAERIQLLVVTKANPREGRHNPADREGFPIERVWADAHPETFELLYGATDPQFRLYRARPPGG